MGTKWNVFTNNLDLVNSVDGLVEGPAVSTDNAVARFDGTTGALLQNSGTTLSDADLLSTGELNLTTDLAVTHGGTGASSLTDGAYLLGSGAGAITALDGTAKGAIPAGDGTTDPTILSVGLDAQVLTADSTEATGLKWTTVAGTGDVTAAANMTDNSLVRGDGGAKGVQDSGILIDDSDNLNLPTGSVLQVNAVSTLTATGLGAAVVGSSLTSVGTIGTGVWEGTAVADEFGGTGQTTWTKGDILYASAANTLSKLAIGTDNQVLKVATDLPNWETIAGGGDVTAAANLTDNSIIRGDGGAKGVQDGGVLIDDSDNMSAIGTLGMGGDLTNYEAVNDGNPQIRMGSADAEELHIQSVYDGGAQTLDYVLFQTDAASATADKGLFRFNVDGTDIVDINDGGVDVKTGLEYLINNTSVLNATTLGGAVVASSLTSVGALDGGSITSSFGSIDNGASAITTTGVITGGTVEATTDTAAADNAAMGYTSGEGLILTGQGSVTDVTIKNDADATVISIPTGTTTVTFAGATNVSSGTVTGPSGTWDSGGVDIATTDTYAIAGTDVLNATTLGTNVVSSSLTTVGTIGTGVWQGTAVADEYGGTGQTTYTKGDILYASAANTLSKLAIGTDTQVLVVSTDVPAWSAAGNGDVTKVNTPVDNQIGVWTGDGTIEGDASFLWDGTGLKIEEVAAAAADTANFGQIWVKNTTPNELWFTDDAGTDFQLGVGSKPNKEYWFAAESLQPIETASASIKKLAGTNVNTYVRAFDDTTEQYGNGKIQVPGDVDTSGTVTFRTYVMAATAAASKNVALTFGHLALNNSEDFDPTSPYTEEDSGDKSIDATQDDVTEITWTETISNLGWAANDLVLFRVSRDPAATSDLTGDMYMFSFAIEIPRT